MHKCDRKRSLLNSDIKSFYIVNWAVDLVFP
jgi:hypothetical protein